MPGFLERPGGRVLIVGGLNMDLFIEGERLPRPGETFEGERFSTGGGGKGANQAVAAARLARPPVRTSMVGQVGDDFFGSELLAALEWEGINREAVRVDPGQSSGVALIFIDADKENYVLPVYGANATCGQSQVEDARSLMDGTSVVLVQQEIPLEVSAGAMRAAKEAGVTVVLDPAPVRPELPTGFLELADLVTPNQGEAEALTGIRVHDVESARRAADELRKRGVTAAIVKLGADGAYVSSSVFSGHFPPFQVSPVATVAAGDAFNGGLAVGLAEGMELRDAVWLAMASGASSVTRAGAQESMGRREEVDGFLASRPSLP